LIQPDSCMVQLPDDRVMTFCAASVRAMSLIPRPYLVDFPLTHHVHILEMNGESYRLKDSKRRRSGKVRS